MTIEREKRGEPFVIQCDECMDTLELEGDSFSEALSEAKSSGYRFIYVDGSTWNHKCKVCWVELMSRD